MKKFNLILLTLFVFGCSQAHDHAAEEAKDMAKDAVSEQVEAAKDMATDKATDQVKGAAMEKVTDQVKGAVMEKATDQVKDAAVDKATDQVKGAAMEKVTDQVKGAVMEKATDQVKGAAMDKATDVVKGAAAAKVAGSVKDAAMKTDAKPAPFQAGIHYKVINPAYTADATDEVVVYEFFGYTCPHCASFEPYMKKLEAEMPENAKLVRVPVVFGKQWQPFAQAYYTFEALGITELAHEPMFQAIHQHKKQFRTIDEIAAWAASSFNVDKEKFLSTAKSFVVDGQIRKGMKMLQAMGVKSTPTLVTNGKFVPNNEALKSRNDIIEITQFLVNQELEAM